MLRNVTKNANHWSDTSKLVGGAKESRVTPSEPKVFLTAGGSYRPTRGRYSFQGGGGVGGS